MNFKIGQKVVCVYQGDGNFVKKGKIYTVLDTIMCPPCNKQGIYLGMGLMGFSSVACTCGQILSKSLMWHGSINFRPIEYDSAHDEIIEKYPLTEEVPDTPIKEPQS